ncbi:MAG: hypothetical protein R3D98_14835 [Candidatus Krumholzibacteriia bacterium]
MKNRLSVSLIVLFAFVLLLAATTSVNARSIEQAQIAFEGDPAGGMGNPLDFQGTSGGSSESALGSLSLPRISPLTVLIMATRSPASPVSIWLNQLGSFWASKMSSPNIQPSATNEHPLQGSR